MGSKMYEFNICVYNYALINYLVENSFNVDIFVVEGE